MREAEIAVKFEPQGKIVHVLAGTTLMEAAAGAGITLDSPCGGRGTCGKCRVRVMGDASRPTDAETVHLTAQELEGGMRLACQSRVRGPLTVEAPETSVLASRFQILGGVPGTVADVSQSAVRKQYVEMGAPGRGDETPDAERLRAALGGDFEIELGLLRGLPGKLRACDFKGTAVIGESRLIDFEPGHTEGRCYAFAADIGTTSLVGVLLDLTTGRECGSVARMNPQTQFGDDVVSRILYARQSTSGLADLHGAVLSEINVMLDALCGECAVRREQVYEAVFSGNTTMQQLLAGVDPCALGEVPFTPATCKALSISAGELGLHIHPRGRVYVFPVIGGFVGGDTVSGLIATGMAETGRATVFVDIGTNGELVVSSGDRLVATSTAAGPAFEGARITHGMRATSGAIEKVIFDGDVRINVIGGGAPAGLCGSALIDVVAELLRCGVLIREGLLLTPDQLPSELSAAIRKRIVIDRAGPAFVLATAEESGTGAPILLTQRDIRELQLATAAVRAGFNILLRRCKLDVSEVDRVLLAGGFGNFIRRTNAQRIGLLPGAIERHRIVFVGNTSLAGARLAAASGEIRRRAETLARRVTHMDLSLDPEFHAQFVESMTFPENVA